MSGEASKKTILVPFEQARIKFTAAGASFGDFSPKDRWSEKADEISVSAWDREGNEMLFQFVNSAGVEGERLAEYIEQGAHIGPEDKTVVCIDENDSIHFE